MAMELLSDVKEKLGTFLNGKNGHLKNGPDHEELEKKFSFDFPTLHADIQEAEAMSLTPMKRGSDEWTAKLTNFLELKEFVYEVEDRLDKLRIKALISQERGNKHQMTQGYKKVRNFFSSSWYRNFGLKFTDLEQNLNNNFTWINKIPSSMNFTAPGNSKSPEVPKVVGRDEDKISIINLLESDDDQQYQQGIPVISIVGPVGIGKSTLAELITSENKIRELFPIQMWAAVSDHEDLGGIAEALLMSANKWGDDPFKLLEKVVNEKKSLLILDDVRILDIEKIEQLKGFLQRFGHRGSRILVTTRNENVARQLSTSLPIFLQPVSMDACWLLCQTTACSHSPGNQGFKEHIQNDTLFMEHMKREIFQRSGIFSKHTERGLKSIMDCEIWDADDYVWDDLCQRVESSYSSLPKHLKLCFKYFSLIPKGYWIEKEVLTQLWMAEGFTNPDDEGTAQKCFDELLLETSFFKDIEKDEDGNIVRCKIHEPLLDIICHLSKDEFSVITEGQPSKLNSLHSSLRCINNMPTADSNNAIKMRTLLCFESPRNLKVLDDLFLHFSSHLKLLRVLDLSLSIIEELPHSISKLEHLRFLNLSYTQIKKLPASILNLYLLQTLKLSHSLLSELPRETWKLQKLRHLEIDGTPMNHLPPWIGRLSNLQLLSEFIVSGDGGCGIEELATLVHLQGRLIISHLNRVLDQEDARTAINTKDRIKHLILDGEKHLNSQNLRRKKRFNSLLLEDMCKETEFKFDDDKEIKRVEKVFESISPHSGLKRLEIWNYFGSKVPNWLAASFSGLVSLKLAKWLKMDHMPQLGALPSLKFLHIYYMAEVRIIDTCYLEGFPKLERLTLEEMPAWEEWNLELPEGHWPCFLELILSNCPKLKNLPGLPQTLRKLEIHDCKEIEWNDGFPLLPTLECLVLKGKVGKLCSLPNAPKLVSMTVALSPDLASFPNGFEKLKSLSVLNIHFCPRLQLLRKELKQLNNLKRLHIAGCRLLTEEWLEKNKEVLKGIPNVEMDNKVLPSGCSDEDDDIHDGKAKDYNDGDSGYVGENGDDDDNSDGEDEDD